MILSERQFKRLFACLQTNCKNKNIKQSGKNKKESMLVKACLQYLALKGYIPIRNNSGMLIVKEGSKARAVKMGLAGSADILACSPNGQFVAIECKADNKAKLTKKQVQFLEEVKKKGGMAVVIRSIDDLLNSF